MFTMQDQNPAQNIYLNSELYIEIYSEDKLRAHADRPNNKKDMGSLLINIKTYWIKKASDVIFLA